MNSHAARLTLIALLAASGPILASARAAVADDLYVASYNRVVKVPSTGGAGTPFGNWPGSITRGIAFDAQGNLYLGHPSAARIGKLTPDGTYSYWLPEGAGVTVVMGMAFDATGDLFTANDYHNRIMKVTPQGGVSLFADTGLNSPMDVAFDAAGNLYVANYNDHNVMRFTPDGVGSVFASTGLTGPIGLAFDADGDLYVSHRPPGVRGAIMKFTPEGAGSVFVGQTEWTFDLAFDSAGFLYASNYHTDTITRFTPDGDGSVFASVDRPWGLAFQIPEPVAAALLIVALPALLARRRRILHRHP